MLKLAGKRVVVIGASRGVGRQIVEAGAASGAQLLAVARGEAALRRLQAEVAGVDVLALDATANDAPAKVFERLEPDVLVLCGGAHPPAGSLSEQTWETFEVNWRSDVKLAFDFCKAALTRPLAPGATVVVISSGAGLAGSPNSGGYAGAKRTQMFIADYAQKESGRMGLGLRFVAIAPRIMPETDIGRRAVAGYARYLAISEADYLERMGPAPTSRALGQAVIALAADTDASAGGLFVFSAKGLEAAPAGR